MDRAQLIEKVNTLVGHKITAVQYVKFDYELEQDVLCLVLDDKRTFTIHEPELHGEGKAISVAPRKSVVNHAGLYIVKAELNEFVEDLQGEEHARTSEQAHAD